MAFNISYIISVTNKFSAPLKQMSTGVKGLAVNFKKAASAGGLVDRQFGKLKNTIKSHPLLTLGGAFLALRQGFGTLIKFETSLNRLSAVTLATTEEMARMESVAKELGRTTAFTASQTAESMTFLANAGFNTNQILKAIPSTLALAAAGHMDLASAGRLSTNVLDQMGMQVEELTRVNDVFAKTQSITNTNVMELAEAFRPVAPIAKKLGFSVEDLAASLGIMASAGETGSISGTLLRNMLTNMSAPGNKAIRVYRKLGINMKEFVNQQGKITDFEGFIANLEALDKAGKISVGQLQTLFGERGFRAATLLMGKGSEKLVDFRKQLQAAGGTAKEMADRQMAGLVGAVLRLKSAYEGFTLSLMGSDATGGALSVVIAGLTTLLTGLTWLNNEFSWILTPIYLFIAALVAVRIATFAYAFASGQLMSVLTGVRAVILATASATMIYDKAAKIAAITSSVLRGAFVRLWLAVAGPIGWIIIGVTAFSAVVYGIYKNWELVISSIKKAASALMFWKGAEEQGAAVGAAGAAGAASGINTQTSQENVTDRFARYRREPTKVDISGEIGVTATGGAEIVKNTINHRTGAAY